jgi:hypothetical protein
MVIAIQCIIDIAIGTGTTIGTTIGHDAIIDGITASIDVTTTMMITMAYDATTVEDGDTTTMITIIPAG